MTNLEQLSSYLGEEVKLTKSILNSQMFAKISAGGLEQINELLAEALSAKEETEKLKKDIEQYEKDLSEYKGATEDLQKKISELENVTERQELMIKTLQEQPAKHAVVQNDGSEEILKRSNEIFNALDEHNKF